MYQQDRGQLGLIACESGLKFAESVAAYLKGKYRQKHIEKRFMFVDTTETHFANGEIKTTINEPIRGVDTYVVQLIDDPLSERSVNDNLLALTTAVNAAFNSDAANVTAVIPQFPNSRQERRKGRESLTAAIVSAFLENCGAGRVLTIDIHAEAIMGFFRKAKLDNLHASRQIVDTLKENNVLNKDTVFVAPDVGSAETARYYSKNLKTDMALIVKERDYTQPSTIIETKLVGDVKNKSVVIVDDMIATGGTLVAACKTLKEFGAKDINVGVTFPFFNGPAVERIDKAYQNGLINCVIGTNSVWHGEDFKRDHPWYIEADVSKLFGKVIYRINHMKSISKILTS